MNNKIIEKIEIFCKYQKEFFPKEATGNKTTEYIAGYMTAIKDILNLIEYEKKRVIKPKKYTLHECKKELFLFAQSVKSIADRLEHDSIAYDVKFPKYSASELRDKANLILERL